MAVGATLACRTPSTPDISRFSTTGEIRRVNPAGAAPATPVVSRRRSADELRVRGGPTPGRTESLSASRSCATGNTFGPWSHRQVSSPQSLATREAVSPETTAEHHPGPTGRTWRFRPTLDVAAQGDWNGRRESNSRSLLGRQVPNAIRSLPRGGKRESCTPVGPLCRRAPDYSATLPWVLIR